MQYDNHKSFPYPVLSDYSNDYVGTAFQATPDLTVDGGQVSLTVVYVLSEKAILELVARGDATYSVLVKCPSTYYRRSLVSREPSIQHDFDPGQLADRVEVSPFIVCRKPVGGYQSTNFHAEYAEQTFSIPAGAVLALDEPKVYYCDQNRLKFGSVIELVESSEVEEGRFRIDLDSQKIGIMLSPATKKKVDDARNDRVFQAYIVSSIVLPALMEVISVLKDEPEPHQEKRWFRALEHRLDDVGESIEDLPKDTLDVAQSILDSPIGRLGVPEGTK